MEYRAVKFQKSKQQLQTVKLEVPVLSCPNQKLLTEGIQVQLIDFIWVLARYLNRDVQTLSSLTAFNMLTRRNKQVQKDTFQQ